MNQKTVIHIGAPFHSIYNDRQKGPTNCRIDQKTWMVLRSPENRSKWDAYGMYILTLGIQVSHEKNVVVLVIYSRFIWLFPKIGVPQNGWFIMENHYKMDDLGGKPTIFGNTHIGNYTTESITWIFQQFLPRFETASFSSASRFEVSTCVLCFGGRGKGRKVR